MYEINNWQQLRQFSHIIWDIDGTITEHDKLSGEVTFKITTLAQRYGVYHSFITGRDAAWVIEKVIEDMRGFYNFARVRDNLVFFAEVGCMMISFDPTGQIEKTIHPALEDHPLYVNSKKIRDKLKALAYDPESLRGYTAGAPIPLNHDVIYDANGVGYLIDRSKPSPKCHPYIWSPYKEVFATFEKIRDKDGKWKTFDQEPYVEIIQKVIDTAGFGDQITIEVVGTALNIVPLVNGEKLGKSWAAGRALTIIQELKLGKREVLDSIIDRTIAVGDGLADLDFTIPTFSPEVERKLQHKTLPIIYVGPSQDLPVRGSRPENDRLLDNIIIQATGRGSAEYIHDEHKIDLVPAIGPRVVSDVLDLLQNWDLFVPF